jgi:hypothetical protein
MKYLSIPAITLFLALAPNTSLAEEKPLKSKLVALSANSGLAEEDKDLQRLFNYSSKPAIRLTFLVKEKNIVQVMKKTVETKDSKGWTCASFPRISEDGGAAAFIIEKDGEFLGKPNTAAVEGTIEIQTGTKLLPKSFSLLAFDEPFRMDNFVFTLLEDKLKVEGNHKLIKEITVEYNDMIIETRGSSWSDNYRTYNYKGIGKGAKISFSYWDGLITKKVFFSKK